MEHQDAKVLRRAAEIVDQGWCQKALARTADSGFLSADAARETPFHPQAGQWCLLGAVMLAHREVTGEMGAYAWSGAYSRAERVLGEGAVEWNNTPGRTADEVATLLRRAAEEA